MHERERQRLTDLWLPENECFTRGYRLIAGIDEAGRGPLAGPVVAAAVILPPGCLIEGLNDSKAIKSEEKRAALARQIQVTAIASAIAAVEAAEIDAMNILAATKKAMWLAVAALTVTPDFLLVDGRDTLPQEEIAQTALVKGDSLSASIAAASILAKNHRDTLMRHYHEEYPLYGFAHHKGYGTAEHRQAIHTYGYCPLHRQTFRLK